MSSPRLLPSPEGHGIGHSMWTHHWTCWLNNVTLRYRSVGNIDSLRKPVNRYYGYLMTLTSLLLVAAIASLAVWAILAFGTAPASGAHPCAARDRHDAVRGLVGAPLHERRPGRQPGVHPRHLGVLPRQRRLPAARRRDHRRGLRGALHPEEGRSRVPRPRRSTYCLRHAGITVKDLTHVGFYDKPLLKFDRILETYLGDRARGVPVLPDGGPPVDQGEALHRSADPRCARLRGDAALRGAPRIARRQCVLPLAIRGSGLPDHGRGRRMGDRDDRRRPGQRHRDPQGVALARLPGSALFGDHLLHRLQGQLGRIQGHGTRALRRAEVRGPDAQGAGEPAGGRLVHPQPEVLQLSLRAHHDERRVRRAVRRSAPRARNQAHPEGDGPRALGSGGDRGDHDADGTHRPPRDRDGEPLPGRRCRAQLRRQREAAPRGPVQAALDPARLG